MFREAAIHPLCDNAAAQFDTRLYLVETSMYICRGNTAEPGKFDQWEEKTQRD